MRKIRTLLLGLIALIAFASNTSAKNVLKPTYIFGFSASFNDSIVYFTNIQQIDSAWISTRTNFLYGRDNYSYQLKNYLTSIDMPNRTCLVEFATTKKAIDKKYQKLMSKYIPKRNKGELPKYAIKHLATSDFQFKALQPTTNEIEEPKQPKRQNKKKEKGKHSHLDSKREEVSLPKVKIPLKEEFSPKP